MKDRRQVLEQVQALKAKIGDKASTENEVATAAKLMRKLLDKYEISQDEINAGFVDIYSETIEKWRRIPQSIFYSIGAIEEYTNTFWFREGGVIVFSGDVPDVAFATWLVDLVDSSSRRAWDVWKDAHRGSYKKQDFLKLRPSFMRGYGKSVAQKIRIMISEDVQTDGSGTEILVTKRALVEQKVYDFFGDIDITDTPAPKKEYMNTYRAGAEAGSNLDFNKPLNTENKEILKLTA